MDQEKNGFIIKGNLIYSISKDKMKVVEKGYLIVEKGLSKGVYEEIPEQYRDFELKDYGNAIIIPGLIDLHVHAPQYSYRGTGMDMELLDWLEKNAFPEESKFRDLAYAKEAYQLFVDEMRGNFTTRAAIFATRHEGATKVLMDLLEESGLVTFVGKVSMDRNAPESLVESSPEASTKATSKWLEETMVGYERTKPILTPRFIPSCSDQVMHDLGELQKVYNLPMQSHLSENLAELKWVSELRPDADFYGDAYDKHDLFGDKCRTIMAHCVHSGEKEMNLLKKNGVYVAHCPASNTNIASGIAPISKYLARGIRVGLGTDVAGGHSLSMLRAMSDAIQVSKLFWRLIDQKIKPLKLEQALYIATLGGGAFFGKVGSFEEGYEADLLVLTDENIKSMIQMPSKERLERLVYLGNESNILHKYVAGKQLF